MEFMVADGKGEFSYKIVRNDRFPDNMI